MVKTDVRRMSTEHSQDLEADPDHPVPNVDVCDIHGARKDGGDDLIVVIASPMDASSRSQRRLIEKLGRYLQFLVERRMKNTGGSGRSGRNLDRIVVKIHPESDPAIFDLLERSKPWVADHDAILEISKSA